MMQRTDSKIEESEIEKSLKFVYPKFNELFARRLDDISILNMGEDSVRYDFFSALTQVLKLKTWDLQLEYPISDDAYVPRMDPKSRRKENPQIDLVITNENLNASFEFGFFKRNSNPKGTINKTGRTLKMINDFVRLGLYSFYTRSESYFVCVADSFMLKHRMDCKVYEAFPATKYYVSLNEINHLRDAVITKGFFDERFFQKAESLNVSFEASLIHSAEIIAKTLEHETRTLVWKIVADHSYDKRTS